MIDALGQMLSSPLMQRALVVTVLVGVSAPVIGTSSSGAWRSWETASATSP